MKQDSKGKLEIPVPSKLEVIFKQYLAIINPIMGSNRLSKTEVEVMSHLLYIKYMYKHLPADKLNSLLFHPKTKTQIREQVSKDLKSIFSYESFNNTMLKLRQKGFITKNSIKHNIDIKDNQIQIHFNLILPNA